MSRIDTSKFHKGLRILYENELWEIIEFNHRVMQQRSPIVKTKLKNIISKAEVKNTGLCIVPSNFLGLEVSTVCVFIPFKFP